MGRTPMSEIKALKPVSESLKKQVLANIAQHGLEVLTYEIPAGKTQIRGISVDGAQLLHEMLVAVGQAFVPHFDPVKDVRYATTWDNPSIPPGLVVCYIRADLTTADGRVVGTYTAQGTAWAGVSAQDKSREDFARRARAAYMAAFSKAQRNLYLHCVPPGARQAFIERVREMAKNRGVQVVEPEKEEEVSEPFQGSPVEGGGSRGGQGAGVDDRGSQARIREGDREKASARLGARGAGELLG